MRYLNEEEYIESYGYFLIDEAFNARQMYIEMTDVLGISELNESNIVSLNETKLDNLKNFVITIGKRVIAAVEKFIDRIIQITGVNDKWLNDNKNNILKPGVISGSIFNNFYRYTNVDQVINNKIVDECNRTILESNKEKWADDEGYISTNTSLNIPGFTYNAGAGDSLQDQIQKFLRGDKEDNIDSKILNPELRAKYYQYCRDSFPAAKTSINLEKDALKKVASDLDAYIATKRSQQNNSTQSSQVTGTQATEEVQQSTTPTITNNSFIFNTENDFLTEVEVKQQPKAQDTTGQNQNTVNKVDTKVDTEKKNNDEITQISKAVRTYYRINAKKLSAKMNICFEAYKNRLKLLKWFVETSNKNNNETTQQVPTNTPQNIEQQTGASMASAFDSK